MQKRNLFLNIVLASSISLVAISMTGCPEPGTEGIVPEVIESVVPGPVVPVPASPGTSPSVTPDPSTSPSVTPDPSTSPSATPDPTDPIQTDTTEPSALFKAQVSGKTFTTTGDNGEKLTMKFNGPGNMVTFTTDTKKDEAAVNKITVMAGGNKVAVFNKTSNGFKVQALQTISIFVNQTISKLLSENPITFILEPGGEIKFDNKDLRSATGNPIVSPTPSPSSGGSSSSGGGSVISGPSGFAG